jgi:uncharacterized membrane protein
LVVVVDHITMVMQAVVGQAVVVGVALGLLLGLEQLVKAMLVELEILHMLEVVAGAAEQAVREAAQLMLI